MLCQTCSWRGPVAARALCGLGFGYQLEKTQGLLTADGKEPGGGSGDSSHHKAPSSGCWDEQHGLPEKLLLGQSGFFCCCCSYFNLLVVPRASRHSQSLATSPALAAKSRAWPGRGPTAEQRHFSEGREGRRQLPTPAGAAPPAFLLQD